MILQILKNISPIDGRYKTKTKNLLQYFSEYALIKYRVKIEILYFIALCEYPIPQLKNFDKKNFEKLKTIYENFNEKDALSIKEIEQKTNHDVKAIEYFMKEKFENLALREYKEFIHFALTSQDINNTAIPLSLKDALNEEYFPVLNELLEKLKNISKKWASIPMLARTHGQPASPTLLGKEIAVFVERLEQQIFLLKQIPFAAKFGGATGNYNAHKVAYPEINWQEFSKKFVKKLGLQHSFPTTQIEHYDHLGAIFDNLKRINTILIDFSRDIWMYISMDYFKQKIKTGEVGSSAMPHKVNPIDFENAEGNLGIANAIFQYFSAKLPISRLQRDLTDSTVLRNIGVPFGHTMVALKAILKGLDKLILNESILKTDLKENWQVVAEAIQTILRREKYPNPYETLKKLTRNHDKINQEMLKNFIENLQISEAVKIELKKITPFNYTGIQKL